MAIPFHTKAATAVINPFLPISSGLVRVVLLNEGSGSPVELVGAGTGTLENSAAWSTADTNLGTTVQFSAGTTTSINFGAGGLSHGNGDLSVFWGGECPVIGGLEHNAGAIAGTGVDTYHFGLNTSGGGRFVLSNVVGIDAPNGQLTAGSYYTCGIAYDKSTSVRFHIYNQTTSAMVHAPETVNDTNTPAQVANNSTVGSKWDATSSWGSDLGFLYVWNRVVTDAEFEQLHQDMYAPFRPTAWRHFLLGVS